MTERKGTTEKKIVCIAFSDRGHALAKKIADALGGDAFRSGQPMQLKEWTEHHFGASDALVFVGAAGIAVRAIAPFVRDKSKDPAVVVIDERALHVIPILSGHLGGANDLARRISGITGSDCVITTATDISGVFAVDDWAGKQSCVLLEKEKILPISRRLLAGGRIRLYSRWPITGALPEGVDLITGAAGPHADAAEPETCDVSLDLNADGTHALHLIPKICVLGVGCRKGTPAGAIEERFAELLETAGIHPAAVCAAASIDLKKDEEGLTRFCREHGWPLLTYSSGQLQQAEGSFTPSDFVASVTGVDNVCERSAVLASGGTLLHGKIAGGGVTMALAVRKYAPDWEQPEAQMRGQDL